MLDEMLTRVPRPMTQLNAGTRALWGEFGHIYQNYRCKHTVPSNSTKIKTFILGLDLDIYKMTHSPSHQCSIVCNLKRSDTTPMPTKRTSGIVQYPHNGGCAAGNKGEGVLCISTWSGLMTKTETGMMEMMMMMIAAITNIESLLCIGSGNSFIEDML